MVSSVRNSLKTTTFEPALPARASARVDRRAMTASLAAGSAMTASLPPCPAHTPHVMERRIAKPGQRPRTRRMPSWTGFGAISSSPKLTSENAAPPRKRAPS